MTSPLLVLDTPTLYYRAFHALPDTLRSPQGRPVNAAKGLLDVLCQLVDQWGSRRLVAVMDADWRPDFRTALLPSYKAHRITDDARGTETPPDLEAQLPLIFDALSALSIPIAEVPGTEADDVIASIVAQCLDEDIVIVSSDRDLLSLLQPQRRVRVHRPRTGGRWETTGAAELPALFQVGTGAEYRALAALRGDPSDGIPGAPGIGDKTAARLIAGWGGLEEVLAAAARGEKDHGLSPKRREALVEHADAIRAGHAVMEGLLDLEVAEFVAGAGTAPDRDRALRLGAEQGLERSIARALAALTGETVQVRSAPPAAAAAPAPVPAPKAGAPGWAQRFVAFDLETTGVDPHSARIVSASLVPFEGGAERPSRNWLVDPGVEIPEAAQRVHGISTERVRAEGTPAAEAVPQLLAAVRSLRESGTPLVGHNIVYDLTVLAAEAARIGVLPSPAAFLDLLPPVLDTLVLDKQADRFRRGPRTLEALCGHYGISLVDAHDAYADARAAGLLALGLAAASAELAGTSAEDLHARQIEWKRTQAAGLQEWLRRKRPDAVVSGGWPLEHDR
ncbi:exonuclease domain-containing protein [Brevibacterium salitolerans]|uniref:5'-3' exonuclease n=1 Tax=Brevibacterium salitolerans TaxID=1403566 RepID=A0ABN2X9D9_9MICO